MDRDVTHKILYGPKRSSVTLTASGMTFSKKYFQYTTGLLVRMSEDTFDTTSPGQTMDGWFSDNLDNITQHFALSLCSSFSQTFTSLSSTQDFQITKSRMIKYCYKQCLYTLNEAVKEIPPSWKHGCDWLLPSWKHSCDWPFSFWNMYTFNPPFGWWLEFCGTPCPLMP